MEGEDSENNFTVQGVGSPVPASVGGEYAGPETSIYSDRTTTTTLRTDSMGVESLAPTDQNATSKNNGDPFKRVSKIPRTPPKKGTPTGPKPPEGPKTARRGIFPIPRTEAEKPEEEANTAALPTGVINASASKETDEGNPNDVLVMEMQKCLNTLKKMKAACLRQKNISIDIKDGIASLEESLDKIKWSNREKKKTDVCCSKPPTTSHEAPQQRVEAGKKKLPKNPSEPGTTKRPPSSPLQKDSEKKTRKISQAAESEDRQANTLTDDVIHGEETYAQAALRGKVTDAAKGTVPANTKKNIATLQGKDSEAAKETLPDKTNKNKGNPTTKASGKQKKRKKKKPRRKQNPGAILIKPMGEETYSGILREIRNKANPDATETVVKKIRETKKGEVLVELGAKTKNKTAFGNCLKEILGEKAVVKNLQHMISLEIMDLDELTTVEEVQEAIRKKCTDSITELEIGITSKNNRSLKMAIIRVNAQAAEEMLKASTVKIGWTHCRIRQRTEVPRCFKCFGYGHKQSSCPNPDRKGQGLCIQCGEKGHKKKDCKNQPKCCLCVELETTSSINHVPGTGSCQVFRKALEEAKKASSK
ncbi:uncharacterized protein LOC129905948 [Episyrphus balteatus]|uniref:uncharacterized protein LOC129905948 n=1 Tax=Episyrphus balteatus TaxID=286459 RepID=UPI002486BC51|nr:uncharacterized protein LOC129905948 [Episyrphus balteatus]